MNKYYFFISFLFCLFLNNKTFSQIHPYKNSNLNTEIRISDLLSRMTLSEKLSQLLICKESCSSFSKNTCTDKPLGFLYLRNIDSLISSQKKYPLNDSINDILTAQEINKIQRFFIEDTRLGIPVILVKDLHCEITNKCYQKLPHPIGLASTWNKSIISNIAKFRAEQVANQGFRQILSPVLNIIRNAKSCRILNSYGEDTFFVSQMGATYLKEFEKLNIIATPKLLLDGLGYSILENTSIELAKRLLYEVYFPPFKVAFQQVGVSSIYATHRSNNVPSYSFYKNILVDNLKRKWGFNGYVISDNVSNNTLTEDVLLQNSFKPNYAIKRGVDVLFRNSLSNQPIIEKYNSSDMELINSAVARVLRVKFNFGLFEDPYIDTSKYHNIDISNEFIQKSSVQSLVLLKNKNNVLPLKKNLSISVIGSLSNDGSNQFANILSNDFSIYSSNGCDNFDGSCKIIPNSWLFHYDNKIIIPGLKASYFKNSNFKGPVIFNDVNHVIDLNSLPFSQQNNDSFSAVWDGYIKPNKAGKLSIGVKGKGKFAIYINKRKFLFNNNHTKDIALFRKFYFRKGKKYPIKIKYSKSPKSPSISFVKSTDWKNQQLDIIKRAVASASKSECAIVCVSSIVNKNRDRASIDLPGLQEKLINAVANVGKPVIVVVSGDAPISMNNWIDKVDAVIFSWGVNKRNSSAIADVLKGVVSPSGRLPITFPASTENCPQYYNNKIWSFKSNAIFNIDKPLFPFGFGLSYSKFRYSNISMSKSIIKNYESTKVTFKVENIGDFDSHEVIQLYVCDMVSSVVRPLQELKGFKKVFMKKGSSTIVSFNITPDMLSLYDKEMNKIVEAGKFKILIGQSSQNIKISTTITVK